MSVPADELRAWAKGDYPTEAAVELLIRAKGQEARAKRPPGGERRFLNIAVSMGSPDHPVDLSNDLSGLDDELLLLVLAATAHAAGRPRLLAPASTVAASPGWDQTKPARSSPGRHAGPTHTSSRTPGSVNPTDPHHARPVRRPNDERRADQASLERPDGPRP